MQCPRYHGALVDLFDEEINDKIIAQNTVTNYQCNNPLTEMITIPKQGFYAFVINIRDIKFVNENDGLDLYEIAMKTGEHYKLNTVCE